MENITLKEIIYNLKNLRQAGRQSQDSLLSDAQYLFIIDQYRATLIGRDADKRKALAPQLNQTLATKFQRVVSMEQDIFAEIRVYKALELPLVIQTSTRPLYQGVRPSLLSPTMPRSTAERIRYDLHSPLTGTVARYFPLGDSLYVVTPDPLQELFVTAIFQSPLKVWELNDKYDPFNPYNFDYPIALNTLDPLYKMMTDGEIRLSMITPNDITADGKEEEITSRPAKKTTEDESSN